MQYTTQELTQLFNDNKITGFIDLENKRKRLGISTDNRLMIMAKGKSRRGYAVTVEAIEVKKLISTDIEENYFLKVNKFRKLAEKANFSNKFIEACLALPKTKEEWAVEKKSLYELGITVGCTKDGEVITLDTIRKTNPFEVDCFERALKEGKKHSGFTFKYRGYDASFWVNEGNDYYAGFSLEYKGTCNGHYYRLINEKTLIYIEKD